MMSTMKLWVLWAFIGIVIAGDQQFFETVDEIGRVQRSLLQAEEGSGTAEEEKVTTTTTTEAPLVLENEAGPTHFYYEDKDNLKKPKFLMKVHEGIIVELFDIEGNETKKFDTFVLDKEAQGGITGSRIDLDKEDFRLVIDYKSQKFIGQDGKELGGLMIEMDFEKSASTWKMTGLKLKNIPYQNYFYEIDMEVVTANGYDVSAPAGLSFACYQPGNFHSIRKPNATYGGKVKFPRVQMQVFEVHRGKFGPEWECGELISIGLWVGILVTLFFATICFWGFSMLASINTMDRFDDPKGKSIYVPQTSE